MKATYCFRYLCISIITIFISVSCLAQGTIKAQADSMGLHAYSAFRGDTLLIQMDTAYLLNKPTFRLYKSNYDKTFSKDVLTKHLIKHYDSLVNFQDSMLKAKEQYYQDLKQSFDSLATTSATFATKTEANAKDINASLIKVNENLNNVNRLLDDSLEKLKKQNQQKLKVALGGFSIGVVVTGLVFLIAK